MSKDQTAAGALAPGSKIAGYEIEEEIGRGGMGTVFRARHIRLDRRVALKVINPEVAHDAQYRSRFDWEMRLAASIEDPHVVPIYEADDRDGVLFLAMQFVAGLDFGSYIGQRGHLSATEAASVLAQIGDGLDAIHAAGLVHRDIKPANVLLAKGPAGESRALITDFGLAKESAATTGLTASGMFLGTIDYAAPEQIEGREVDARTDIYAAGCMLFTALTGKVPFPESGPTAKMWAHLNTEPPLVTEHIAGVSEELNGVIQKAMAKRPSDRFLSGGDFGRAALGASHGNSTVASPTIVATGAAGFGTPPAPPVLPSTLGPDVPAPRPSQSLWSRLGAKNGRIAGAGLLMLLLVIAGIAVFEPDDSERAGGDSTTELVSTVEADGSAGSSEEPSASATTSDDFQPTLDGSTTGDEQAVIDQLLGYGSALGPEGCLFFSSELISLLGGDAGCAKELRNSPSVTFEPVSATVTGDTAVATMRNTESQKTQTYEMVNENGTWLINGLQ